MARLASLALVGALLCPASALAQSVRLDQYRMAETAADGFSLSRPNDIGHVAFGVRLDVDYAANPLVYQLRRSDASTELSAVVEHLVAAQLGVSFGLFDRLVFYVGLPVNLLLDGSRVEGQPRADGSSLGDLSFGLRARLFGEEEDAFAVALQLTGTAPTAQAARFQSRFAGEGGWTAQPELLFEIRITEYVRITGNAGAILRDEQDFGRLRVGHEFTWGGAFTVAVVPDTFLLTVESWGASAFDRFGEAQVSPVELVGGLRVLPVDGMSIGLAAGTGVARGYGAGDFRAIFSLGYVTPTEEPVGDRDQDGLNDDVDECPDEPEDADRFEDEDGCPDPDNDGDGILDEPDVCPNVAEDMDGLGDEDGCPEADFDGDEVADEVDRCPSVPGDAQPQRAECLGCPDCDPPVVESEPPPVVEPSPSIEARVLFDIGSHAIRSSQLSALREVLGYLRSHPGTSIVVEGHADFRGSEPNNQALSRQRARRVMTWLRLRGVSPEQLTGAGCGETFPAQSNHTRQGRRANRRVEFRSTSAGPVLRGGCVDAARRVPLR